MARKPRVVFDTNILISSILFGGAPRMCLEGARQGKIELVTSRAILLELGNKLRDKFEWSEEEVIDIIVGLGRFATIIRPAIKIDIIKGDPSDNKNLEAAVESGADFIISGDQRHILPLKKFRRVKIITAAEFLKQL